MKQTKISDAELILMEHIWENEGIRAAQLVQRGKEEMGWSRNTTYTLLARMVEKELIRREDPGFSCTALVSKEQVQEAEIDELVEKKFGGSLPAFVAAFTRHGKMTEKEIDQVQRMIDRFRKGDGQ